tara:strand:- start:250 stop:765 length:516 start_codon:yes stop_codon:yes gene_type:complete
MAIEAYFARERFEREYSRFNPDSDPFTINNLTITKSRDVEDFSVTGDVPEAALSAIRVHFKYKKQYDLFEFPNLPFELNQIIHGFNAHFIYFSVIIVYPIEYPFRHTFWYFDKFKTNSDNPEYVKEFFKYKLSLHRESLKPHLWSPSGMNMEKDILSFLVKINYFEDIIDC